MAFHEFSKEFNFNVKFSDFLKQIEKFVIGKTANFKINYLWIHETVTTWQKQIVESELFNEMEISIILPPWLLYFHKLLKVTNTDCYKKFINFAIREFKETSKLFNEQLNNWDILFKRIEIYEVAVADVTDGHNRFNQEQEGDEFESLSSVHTPCTDLSETSIQNYDSLFLIKCNFILDLFAPNRFQYAILREVFDPNRKRMDLNTTLQYPYQLQFINKNFMQLAKRPSVVNENDLKIVMLPLADAQGVNKIFENLDNYIEENAKKTAEEPYSHF